MSKKECEVEQAIHTEDCQDLPMKQDHNEKMFWGLRSVKAVLRVLEEDSEQENITYGVRKCEKRNLLRMCDIPLRNYVRSHSTTYLQVGIPLRNLSQVPLRDLCVKSSLRDLCQVSLRNLLQVQIKLELVSAAKDII